MEVSIFLIYYPLFLLKLEEFRMEKYIKYNEINTKNPTLADCNAITELVTELSFIDGKYSPMFSEFFKLVYSIYITVDILDEYISKDENNTIQIKDINKLFAYVESNGFNNTMCCGKGENMRKVVCLSIDKAIEYRKQEILNSKYSLTDISLSNLIDTINNGIEELEKNISTEKLETLLNTKDKVLGAITDISKQKDIIKDIKIKNEDVK